MTATPLELPSLSTAEREHTDTLLRRICAAIDAAGGWISFERYMEMALFEPGLGYYSAGAFKFGAHGDFVTAPEISRLFGRCIAAQAAEVLTRLGGGDVLEFGAGSGGMAADVLLELEALGRLPGRYLILDVSADLRERQRRTIMERAGDLAGRVEWLDAPPAGFVGIMLANEVLDAFPVERFRVRSGAINALGVTWQLGRLDWSEIRAPAHLTQAVRAIEQGIGARLPEGYTSEWSPRLAPWIATVAAALARGVVLLIDYGLSRAQYYRPERVDGTLLCHFRHRFHADPFRHVGLQDIGAWVDFTAVAEAAVAAGLAVAGYATQAHFLIAAGLERLLAATATYDLEARLHVSREAMVLTLPGEMGERFKVIALTKDYDAHLCGFALRDLAASL
jgi:SAM-dependent MidA family methyltransferase